ncbi:hypothetical protein K466DRAFT_606643 [Polyporus arcularius HHB13444]|uniref:Uncharacterized protein n=1 Tax=Polyporus arcularius HHB13444 TaxID=1314778 RepID=A0A5C3NZB9_9APHY|nr:hypothetical protein K466DRAFT_606643 [Polyporus arcularius HHB13444]
MSSVPNHYNADDRVRWERYAAALQAYGAGQGPHPGNPPAGYREVFKLSQRYAPVPEDYPAARHSQPPHAPALAGVNMSDGAFSALLAHTATVNAQFVALQSQVLSDARRIGTPRPYEARRGRGGGPSYGRRGPRLVDRVAGRDPAASTAGSGKRKRGHRGGRARTRRSQKGQGTDASAGVESPEAVHQPGECTVLEFMRTLVERFALMFPASKGLDTAAGNGDDGDQEPAVEFAELAQDDPDYQMTVEQYGQGDGSVTY